MAYLRIQEIPRPLCKVCGEHLVKQKGITSKGFKIWATKCWRCVPNVGNIRKAYIHRRSVKSSCERCGFVPEHSCQLEVHHLDNNHGNNDTSNLMTLCANCHRLTRLKLGRKPFIV